ncbi:MAG: hypothetical protein Q9226_000733, partial [Calogaya cf. arnoldii]
MSWGAEKSSRPGMETYVPQAQDTFDDMQHWRLTQGYGAMREGEYQLQNIMKTLMHPLQASFIEFPEEARGSVPDGVIRLQQYLPFVNCGNEELRKTAYHQGTEGTLCFDKPDPNAPTKPENELD